MHALAQAGAPLDVRWHSLTPLHVAVAHSHVETVRRLVQHGANVDTIDNTPIAVVQNMLAVTIFRSCSGSSQVDRQITKH